MPPSARRSDGALSPSDRTTSLTIRKARPSRRAFAFPETAMINWYARRAYEPEIKQRFHTTACARLRRLATALGFPPGSFDLRSNAGGIAVSGEITPHHDHLYVQVCQPATGADSGILIRTCPETGAASPPEALLRQPSRRRPPRPSQRLPDHPGRQTACRCRREVSQDFSGFGNAAHHTRSHAPPKQRRLFWRGAVMVSFSKNIRASL